MESGQTVLRLLANVSRKSRDGAGVSCLQQRKGIEIAFGGGIIILLFRKGLESAYHLASASQDKIADRPPVKLLHPFRQGRADANTGAELFVSRFEARCHIDGIAVGRVVEKPAAPKIADDRRSRM